MNESKSHLNNKWLAGHVASLPRSGIRDFFEVVSSREGVVSLGIGEPDFPTPWGIREATIYALDKGHTSYTSNLGLLSLRRECCRYVSREFGVDYDPASECIITVGVSEALDLIMRAVLNPGDEVIYHEPSYVSYAPSVVMNHAVPVAVTARESEGFGLRVEDIRRKITPKTKVLLLNYPNNPTGGNLSREDTNEIAKLAVEHDLLVITDEIYSELIYDDDTPHTIAACPGMRDRTVFLHGFSKAFAMTGYRIGYACGPHELIEAMMKIHQYSMLCASGFAQEAALEALRNGDEAREAMRLEYEQRRNLFVKRLNSLGLYCNLPRGAFYVFPRIKDTGLASYDFAMKLLEEQNVAVVPGPAFGAGGEGYIRCSYAASMADLETAVTRIGKFLEDHAG